MDLVAYNATMQQFRAAVERARSHCNLAKELRARWPLASARAELEEAQVFLALAKAELQRPEGTTHEQD